MLRPAQLLVRHLRYGPASWSERASPRKTAALHALFRGVNGWLRASGVTYWLAYGTLLGWHREKRPLPHDRDIDFGVELGAYARLKAAAPLLPAGFSLHDSSHRHRGPKLYVVHRGWEADLYFYADEQGQMCSLERSRNPGDTTPFPREFVHPVQAVPFLDETTFIPAQPVALLTHHYRYLGPDAVRDPVTRYFRPRS